MKPQTSKQNQLKKRLDIMKSWMTSFVMTVGAVIAVVVFVPKSPQAIIQDVKVFETSVSYQVEVTDADHALELSSLKIQLINQFESYTYPLSLGLNVGVFDELSPNTTYQLHIYGSKGFGQERLDHRTIKTKAEPGSAIIGYQIIETLPHGYTYQIDVMVDDLSDQLTNLGLYYAIGYEEPPDPMMYESFEIVSDRQSFIIENVSIYNASIYLYIEGMKDGNPILLDELKIEVPYHLESSVYLDAVSQSTVGLTLYPDFNAEIDAVYTAKLYLGYQIIQTIVVTPDESHDMREILFERLKQNQTYRIDVEVTFTNPQTLIRETRDVYSEEVTTLDDYELTYTIETLDDSYIVTIYLIDPNHYFQMAFFTLYATTDDFHNFIDGESYGFTPDGTGKGVTFEIMKPAETSYRMVIGIYNQTTSYIRHIIVDETING